MPKNKTVLTSDFYCTCCGKKGIPIARKIGQQRKPGHLKRLFCLYCQKETNHAEIRPYGSYRYENFKEEYELGRFYNGLKIPIAALMGCSNTECPYNKNGRCWNSNYSYECSYRLTKSEEEIAEMYEKANS